MAVTIQDVHKGSPADKAGLQAGMQLVSINQKEIHDGLDYEFYSAGDLLDITVRQDGKQKDIRVEKEEYQPLGCLFATYLIDKHHSCKNRCVFCFIDQLPKGMRSSLYFKDDDERLSFLFGNYITLTNLSEREVQRIIEMRISPVNISVHTTNPELRNQMMGNKNAGKALEYIPRFAQAGITMNCQLVLCPGLNDGQELVRSMQWLSQFAPAVQSVAAVPAGLTQFRQGLAPLRQYTKQQAEQQLGYMLKFGDDWKQKTGTRLVYPADEWFVLAQQPIPPEEFYEEFYQLENGVGMWRLFYEEFASALQQENFGENTPPPNADIVTGVLAAPLLQQAAQMFMRQYPGVQVQVHPVSNRFFGKDITVSGLLTGEDIAAQLAGNLVSNRVLLPENLLRAEGDLLLDGLTPQQLGQQLGAEAVVVACDGKSLLDALLQKQE